jgi:hypothetical protein
MSRRVALLLCVFLVGCSGTIRGVRPGTGSCPQEPRPPKAIKRGVAKDNPLGRLFHDAATKKWGQLYPYTGD